MSRLTWIGLAVLTAGCAARPTSVEQPVTAAEPVHQERSLCFDTVLFDGTAYGRLIPAFGDIGGDTRTDLLVGAGYEPQACEGRLLVFRNRGSAEHPDYAPPEWFHASVPTGRIPES